MSRRPNDKPPKVRTQPAPEDRNAPPPDPAPALALQSRIGLTRLDWIAVALIAIALLIAPIWAASFATPAKRVSFTPDAIALEGPLTLSLEVWTGPLVLMLIGAAYAVLARREWLHPVRLPSVRGLTTALGLLGIWAALGCLRPGSHYLNLNALSYLFGGLILGGICSRLGRETRAMSVLSLTIALAGSLIAGIGVREYLGYFRDHVVDHRTFSTFGPDFLAGYLLLTLPLTLSAFAASSDRSLRVLLGLGIALQSGCLFLTGSRAGTVIGLVGVVVWVGLSLLIGFDRATVRRIAIAGTLFLVGSIVSATPTVMRFQTKSGPPKEAAAPEPGGAQTSAAPRKSAAASDADGAEQSADHSSQFRKYTWMGTVRMAIRNPLTGTGIGSFAVAYPRYAETAFTAHAHNSFLQWLAETGFPGAFALLTALAAASAFIVYVLIQVRENHKALEKQAKEGSAEGFKQPEPLGGATLEPTGLMLAGFIASLVGSTIHSLFDSDLYIIATLLTFCAIFALAVATAGSLVRFEPEEEAPVSRAYWVLGALAVVFMFVRAGQIGLSRWHVAQIGSASSGAQAAEEARAAAAADPFDPDPHFLLASMHSRSAEAESQLRAAANTAPSGMTYYLLGRHYREQSDWKPAIEAFERSLSFEPHNLQTLRALAETQRKAGLPSDARSTYRTMTLLEKSPYGTVLSMPELIETDYAYAHAGLADIALEQNDVPGAQAEADKALAELRRYWKRRMWLVNEFRAPEKRRALGDLYLHVLETEEALLKQENRPDALAKIEKEHAEVTADIQKDSEKNAASAGT